MEMDFGQLQLFSQPNDMLTQGYEQLSSFKFDEAEFIFGQIDRSFNDHGADTDKALLSAAYWKTVFSRLESILDSEKIFYLYNQLNRFEFSNDWGDQKLWSSLISFITGLMIEQGVFYINQEIAMSDLLLQIGKRQMAEQSLTAHISSSPIDTPARFRLAQLQWKQKQKGAALQNYTLGLLLNPENVPFNYLECDKTQSLIQNHEIEMVPGYGWIAGILPLMAVPDNVIPLNEKHGSALECYRLLRAAEKASKKQDIEATVNYRKALKAGWPTLYDEYYALISKRVQPSFY